MSVLVELFLENVGFSGEEFASRYNSLVVSHSGSFDGEGDWVPCLVHRFSFSPFVF